jgi:phosphatidylglycerol:prolipoprotein diacylglycerol transferase
MIFSIPFPAIDPVIFSFGPVAIRWYSLAYIAGLVLGWQLLRILVQKSPKLTELEEVDDFLVWVTLGVILGGRLGYVIFYNLTIYLNNPLSILAVWQGGMSFHGGLLGVIGATILFCHKRNIDLWPFADRIACVAPIGIFFGRLANFINGELFGRISDVSWAVVFPQGGPEARHPSQIYEAMGEGFLLFLIMMFLVRNEMLRRRPGFLTGVFFLGYGIVRTGAEYFRQPDAHIGYLSFGLTTGQCLSAPLVLAGCWLVFSSMRKL